MVFQCWDGLSLDTTFLHFPLKVFDVADSREEMRLSASITIEGSKPLIPVLFWGFRFLEIADDGEFLRREESIVNYGIILPAIGSTGYVIRRLFLQPGTIFEVQLGALDIVELKGILFKHASDTTSLDPKQSSK